jgi:protein-disulfide isomerase
MKRFFSIFIVAMASIAALSAQKPIPPKVTKPEIVPGTKKPSAEKDKATPSALDKTTLENYVRHLQAWDRSITVEVGDPKPAPLDGFYEIKVHASKDKATQDVLYYVSKDGKHILQGSIFATAENPYKEDLDKLKGITAFAPNYGTTGAPVVIVEFSDFQCPYCREEAKSLRTNLLAAFPKEVHLYHLDMPLENIHPWARPAAIAGHCVYKQDPATFWNYYDWIYDKQSEITPENLKAKVLEWAKGTKEKIDSLQLNRCMDNKETDGDISMSQEQARNLEINQTPMFFVNGRRMPGAIEWPVMKHVIEEEIVYQKTAKNAGEDCGCSVTLPSMGTPAATPPLGGLK